MVLCGGQRTALCQFLPLSCLKQGFLLSTVYVKLAGLRPPFGDSLVCLPSHCRELRLQMLLHAAWHRPAGLYPGLTSVPSTLSTEPSSQARV